jgi:hypothetical protein
MTVKDDLHHLVDELDDETAREALARLQDLRLPRLRRQAPISDQPGAKEERPAVAETEAAIAGSDAIHDENVERELRNELRKG